MFTNDTSTASFECLLQIKILEVVFRRGTFRLSVFFEKKFDFR